MKKIHLFSTTRTMFGLLAVAALGFSASAASADSYATRCDERGCVRIHCDDNGNRCYRSEAEAGGGYIGYNSVDDRYDRNSDSYDRDRYEGDRYAEPSGDSCGAYDCSGYGDHFRLNYSDRGYGGDADGLRGQISVYRVCDSDGDRCYRSASATWHYRDYYRFLGYRWTN